MKKPMIPLLILLLTLITLQSPAFAAKQDESGVSGATATLKMTFPRLEFDSVHATPVEGVYEVVSGDRIIYFVPRSQHLIYGEIWDAQGQSLTRTRQAQMMADRIKDLPLEKALKIGDGKNVVIEITDPDCPFCRKASEFLSERDDVTRYIYFYPLTRIHPEAEAKVRYILSAKNPAEAYEDVMRGRYDGRALPQFEDNRQLEIHQEIVTNLGVRGTPKFWVNGTYLSGADLQAMEKLMNGSGQGR
ncbi:thiol:disulfide interchange protein DsbC [Geoalkalibacter ferrihydriticus]|uniref:Thiol:disulfide interchange protein DsbC n=1 Tax=Geoalkalibacter ferrihydriticus TaxID=392333 RepID=A0A1G9N2I6_9BACT|nr:DsbC family protein [Geoalkalibacter ferrihydriticus]SDL80065.1 thiol:disulfide interchange protein DsbC [Geoalkalibacter ferrihydriticus]